MLEQLLLFLGNDFIHRTQLFVIVVTLLVFFIATLTDMKKREVPDTLNYIYLGSGIIFALIMSLHNQNTFYIMNSVIGILLAYGLGSLLYYMGQWGGGDAKLLLGFGAWHGLFYETLSLRFSEMLMLNFILLLFIAGGVYGLFYLIFLFVKNKNNFKVEKQKKTGIGSILILLGSLFLLFLGTMLTYPLNVLSLVLAITLSLMYLLMKHSKNIEDSLFIKDLPIEKVTEGDWLQEDIKLGNKIIVKKTGEGISKEEIEKLKKLYSQGKIKTIKIKEGIPFVPAFLLGYILLLLI